MKFDGIKLACSATKKAQPYRFYVQINVDVITGDIYNTEHCDCNSETRYHVKDIIHVITTDTPMTMAQIKDACQIAISDHQALAKQYD